MKSDLALDRPVTFQKAKTNLSRLLAEVERGGAVTIARGSTPVARLVPIEPRKGRMLGFEPGRVEDAVLDPLDEDELRAWGL